MTSSRGRFNLATALLVVLTARAHAACVQFQAPTGYDTGSAPASVAVTDFNKDGRHDLAVTSGTNSVQVFLRGATGAFGAPASYATGLNPAFVLAADFNNDGNPDLAVANRSANNVSILNGLGDGSFGGAVQYPVGFQPLGIAAADFNRDGRVDLAVANFVGNSVSIMLGGPAGFTVSPTTLSAAAATSVTAADFNRDGKPDLAVTKFNSSALTIYLGAGDGTFGSGSNLTTAANPRAVAVGDMNGDGSPDLAVVHQGSSSVGVFLGAGDATFAARLDYSAGTTPRSIAIGDLTGDGKLDLAVANQADDDVSLLSGPGDGTFPERTDLETDAGPFGDGPVAIALGLLDSDNLIDLVTANATSADITVLMNSSACTTNCGQHPVAANYAVGQSPRRAAKGDFNRDGNLDLAVPNLVSNTVTLLLGDGNGSFTAGTPLTTIAVPTTAAVADFNRDGRPDLAVGHGASPELAIFLGNGDGTFSTGTTPSIGAGIEDIATTDLNRDGRADLVAVRTENAAGTVAVLLGNGDGTFATATSFATGGTGPIAVEVADFNRDGKLDLVTNAGTSISLLLGDGAGSFAAPALTDVGDVVRDLVVGDFTADGLLDLSITLPSNTLPILKGTGSGTTFVTAGTVTFSHTPFTLAIIDAGPGGTTIAATLGFGAHKVATVFLAPSTGIPGAPRYLDVGTDPRGVVGGDFNGDGRDDLAVTNVTSANLTILLNFCETSMVITPSSEPSFYGREVTFSAAVYGPSALLGPTGTVTFREGEVVLGTVALDDETYTAYLATSSLALGAHTITATYNGDATFHTTTASITQTVIVGPPRFVWAIASKAPNRITVNWTAAAGADSYNIYRTSPFQTITLIGSTSSLSFVDSMVSVNYPYVYSVRSVSQPDILSPHSVNTVAYIGNFTDDPIAAGMVIKKVHLLELRTAVMAIRSMTDLDPYFWTDPTSASLVKVKRVHIADLTTALSEAWVALGMPAYNGSNPATGAIVRASDFNHVVALVRSGPYGGAPD